MALLSKTPYRDFPRSQVIYEFFLSYSGIQDLSVSKAAMKRVTDCFSTDGLVAPIGADPDTNRSAGLQSESVITATCHWEFSELSCCRSDLFIASLNSRPARLNTLGFSNTAYPAQTKLDVTSLGLALTC
jgi:hypothetical protein